MVVADEVLVRVRRADRGAVQTLLSESYAAVHRIAHGLAGEVGAGQRIVRLVLRQAIRVMPKWRPGIIAENYFYHHTLLASRRIAPRPPPAERDLLISAGPAEPAYAAFVRALRALPRQQMEAFVLNQGEKLNSRLLGVAMDCSTQAADAHLTAATQAMTMMAGEQFAAMAAALSQAYSSLSPPPTVVQGAVRRQVRSAIWAKGLRRLVKRVILLAILATLAYGAWRYRYLLRQGFETVRARVHH